ncbi:hypothetical protein BS50DRAFT_256518 [Corynespora cassiicola Philippines]|uniref:Uncharacterized protein n=1 Tax=Corynespora cassiicola Philippines TaxID=1448308 RepID=A0A2T2P4M6_CORCC|nr:hypothetical protein BS50DRAFT_256518 [Corynespora cassiicola Philippines]
MPAAMYSSQSIHLRPSISRPPLQLSTRKPRHQTKAPTMNSITFLFALVLGIQVALASPADAYSNARLTPRALDDNHHSADDCLAIYTGCVLDAFAPKRAWRNRCLSRMCGITSCQEYQICQYGKERPVNDKNPAFP